MYRKRQTKDPPLEVWKPRLPRLSKETFWLIGHATHIMAGVFGPVCAILAVVAALDHLTRLAWFLDGTAAVMIAWAVFFWSHDFRS